MGRWVKIDGWVFPSLNCRWAKCADHVNADAASLHITIIDNSMKRTQRASAPITHVKINTIRFLDAGM